MKLVLFLLAAGFFAGTAAGAALDPANERFMEVSFAEGIPVSDAMSVYLEEKEWYLPLLTFAEGLGINIKREGDQAAGFLVSENRKFSLTLLPGEKCRFVIQNEEKPCEKILRLGDEMWVTSTQLEHWFPLHLKIDSFASSIQIETKESFPAQLRRERERQAAQLAYKKNNSEAFPEKRVEKKALDGFFLDQQLNFARSRAQGKDAAQFTHESVLAGELAGFETRAFASGDRAKFSEPRLTFRRYSEEGQLLGKLGANDVQLFDVEFPSQNLLGGAGLGRGFVLSQSPPTGASDFRSQDISGDLLPNWEVELYQNDALLGRQVSTNKGRYLFSAIPLRYGLNTFRLVFYGPQGQKREETRNFNIDPSIVRPGKAVYRLAAVQTHELNKPRAPRLQASFEKNLFSSMGLKAGWAQFIPDRETVPFNYYNAGVRGFYGDYFLYTDASYSREKSGALETGAQGQVMGSTFGLTHTVLNHFVSDVFNRQSTVKYQTKASTGINFLASHSLRATFDFLRKANLDRTLTYALQNRLSTRTGPLYWFNDINYEWGNGGSSFGGKLSQLVLFSSSQLRTEFDYDRHHLLTANALLQKAVNRDFKIDLGLNREIQSRKTTFNVGLNRDFHFLTGSLTAAQSTTHETTVALLASYSLGYDSHAKNFHVDSRAQATEGAASVLVFLDRNNNGRFDSGDEALPEIVLRLNGQDIEERTDASGRLFLSHLPAHEFSEISISLRSIADPAWRPKSPGVRIFSRPGKAAELQLPVIVTGEISGTVRQRNTGAGAGHKSLLLKKKTGEVVKELKTESDGFYLIDGLETGNYTIEMPGDSAPEPRQREIAIPPSGAYVDNQNFTVSEKQ